MFVELELGFLLFDLPTVRVSKEISKSELQNRMFFEISLLN